MILGIDIGNYSVKTYPGKIIIKSLVSTEENLLGSNMIIEYDNKKYVIGEGIFETELNKSNKENFIPLLYAAIASATSDTFNQIICGLPINQFKNNKLNIEKIINENKVKNVLVNGVERKIVITDFKVYPEGVGAYYSLATSKDSILVDIGGRTTDIAFIANNKLSTASTVNVGTLDIYKAISDKLNTEYCMNLSVQHVDRIIERGELKVDNKLIDLSFITSILKTNFMKIKEELDFKYPARTEQIILTGGGAKHFERAFKKRYSNCELIEDPVYANAKGFSKVGESLWQ